jgi:hypothetical protein
MGPASSTSVRARELAAFGRLVRICGFGSAVGDVEGPIRAGDSGGRMLPKPGKPLEVADLLIEPVSRDAHPCL